MKTIFLILPTLVACAMLSPQPQPHRSAISQALYDANNATHPTDAELMALNYGVPPKNYQAEYKKAVLENLKDPDSAKFRNIQKPKKFWGKSLPLRHSWLVCGEVNAKNSYGGYNGYQLYAIQFFPNGSTDNLVLDSGVTKYTYASERTPCSN